MYTWKDEVKQAMEAGEREFGPLDAHHTIKRNLLRRCEEIMADQPQPVSPEQSTSVTTEGEEW